MTKIEMAIVHGALLGATGLAGYLFGTGAFIINGMLLPLYGIAYLAIRAAFEKEG